MRLARVRDLGRRQPLVHLEREHDAATAGDVPAGCRPMAGLFPLPAAPSAASARTCIRGNAAVSLLPALADTILFSDERFTGQRRTARTALLRHAARRPMSANPSVGPPGATGLGIADRGRQAHMGGAGVRSEMPQVADMMGPMLRGISDGRMYSVDRLEEILAERMGLARHDLDVRANGGSTTDVRRKIGLSKSYLRQAGLVSYPRRGLVMITRKGLTAAGCDPGILPPRDGGARGRSRAGKAARPATGGAPAASTAYSPPLSAEEIADIKAFASGSEKMHCVSREEFARIIEDAAAARPGAGRRAP